MQLSSIEIITIEDSATVLKNKLSYFRPYHIRGLDCNNNPIPVYNSIYQSFIYNEYDRHIDTINTRFTKIESEMIHLYFPPIPLNYIQIQNNMPNLEFNCYQLQMFIKEINIFKRNIYYKYDSLDNIYNTIIKMLQKY